MNLCRLLIISLAIFNQLNPHQYLPLHFYMYRPIIALPFSSRYLDTDFTIHSLAELDRIQWLLIPSLELVGVESTDLTKKQEFQDQKKKLNIKNLFFGSGGQFEHKSKVEFAKDQEILEVHAQATIHFEIPSQSKQQAIRGIQDYIEEVHQNIVVLVKTKNQNTQQFKYTHEEPIAQKFISSPSERQDGHKHPILYCKFVVPSNIRPRSSGTRQFLVINCTIPFIFFMEVKSARASTLVDIFCKQLSSSIKIMTRNDILYRSVYKQGSLILNNYTNQKSSKRNNGINKHEKRMDQAIKNTERHQTHNQNKVSNLFLIILVIILILAYLGFRSGILFS